MDTGRAALGLDYANAEREVLRFIRKVVHDAGAKGVVLGLSGGIDSAVVGALCVKALGKDQVTVLIMPSDFTPDADVADAALMAAKWGVKTYRADISKIAERFFTAFPLEGDKIAKANLQARVRMVLDYFVANTLGLLVAGTGDKSEDLLGYYSKYGDGGVDFLPIAHLYKTQVRKLGARLGIPEKVVEKPASPQLWPRHRAAEELPADYDKLDPLLYYLFDAKLPLGAAAKKAGVSKEVAEAAVRMHRSTAHKRAYPPMVRPWSAVSRWKPRLP